MVKEQIISDLKKAISALGFETTDVVLSIPENSNFGDYTTNVALQLANQKGTKNYQSPQEIANDLLEKLGHPLYLDRVEVAGPGFVNLFIKASFLAEDLKDVLGKKESYGSSEKNIGKKARVEFISANPTGPLHIGNARGGPLGDTLANILQFTGYEVLREYIHNDVGNQVWQLGRTLMSKIGYFGSKSPSDSAELQYKGEYIDDLASKVKQKIEETNQVDRFTSISAEEQERLAGKIAVDIQLQEILDESEAMGIKFDHVVNEGELQNQAEPIIDELIKKGVAKKKDGAIWLAPSDEFLKDRETVIKKSDGGYTYFTADIVYHLQKFESGADLIIDVFGSNHHGHIPRLQAAVAAFGFDVKKLKFILYQFVRVKRGEVVVKMSKRAGDVVTAGEVLNEVGKDAFRFMLLHYAPQTHMDFDIELVKEHSSKNPIYYVQYAHARMVSILNKAGEIKNPDLTLLEHDREKELIKHLLEFSTLIEEISESFQVHKLTEYSLRVADLVNRFYEECPVLIATPRSLMEARVELVRASKFVLSNSLRMLGVSAPERM